MRFYVGAPLLICFFLFIFKTYQDAEAQWLVEFKKTKVAEAWGCEGSCLVPDSPG